MEDQNKNLILATALSFLVILVWFLLFPPEDQAPNPDPDSVTTESAEGTEGSQGATDGTAQTASTPEGAQEGDAAATGAATAQEASEAARVEIDTPELTGSISLRGGRLDDLSLKNYRDTIDEDSPLVKLLSPVGSEAPYYALYGWAPSGGTSADGVPGPNTIWNVESEGPLTPENPVTLSWDNGNGLSFSRTISIDEDYMFSISQSVENTTEDAVSMAPYGIVARHGEPDTVGYFILHEGVVRMSDGELQELDYSDMPDLEPDARGPSETIDVASDGWVGFTDKYWMTTLIPAPGSSFKSTVRYSASSEIYQTEAVFPTQTVEPGQTVTADAQLFAGAKEWETIRHYQEDEGIQGFVDSIDWGWFFFLTKPMFWVLHTLHGFIGNMGWSIIILTLCVKAVLFPLAYKSYVSMARMKELQPEMEKLKEKAGDDREQLQKGMMELYKKNKVNPASGCLPILLQIPIFFSLYKVIFVTIELRHAPWFGWIRDLSAPDPSSILNLFGLLPFAAPGPDSLLSIISLGILPILLGVSMWLQQKLNPAPADKTQATIFAWMPWVFMFMLGGFASGLVLYWIANNTITFTQQYAIMRSQGYKPDILGNIKGGFKRGEKADSK